VTIDNRPFYGKGAQVSVYIYFVILTKIIYLGGREKKEERAVNMILFDLIKHYLFISSLLS
jgi:hypothetical protein